MSEIESLTSRLHGSLFDGDTSCRDGGFDKNELTSVNRQKKTL